MATAEIDIEDVLLQVNIPNTNSADASLESDESYYSNVTTSEMDRSHTAAVMDTDKSL